LCVTEIDWDFFMTLGRHYFFEEILTDFGAPLDEVEERGRSRAELNCKLTWVDWMPAATNLLQLLPSTFDIDRECTGLY
jgi:hypothetical protein